jgi:hypothetical protein
MVRMLCLICFDARVNLPKFFIVVERIDVMRSPLCAQSFGINQMLDLKLIFCQYSHEISHVVTRTTSSMLAKYHATFSFS